MRATRRTFFGIMGSSPFAAKKAVDLAIGEATGMVGPQGLGDASLRLFGNSTGLLPNDSVAGENIPYGTRLIVAAQHIKTFGIPDHLQFEMRDAARYVTHLDADIASKVSWSMAIKIQEQRQRNYERAVKRIERSGWQHQSRKTLKSLLGFDWPW